MSREREIFGQAIEIDDLEKRIAFVDQSCSHDIELRKRVHELLDLENEDSSFLSEEQLASHRRQELCLIGTHIGRYKLLEEIGDGGCGIVYMAEQRVPVRRKVAVKVIKPGMDTREVVARFEAERQALAMMDHPNIAGVLDGGTTDQGRPYFVMELVDGVPITEFCDANRTTVNERLKLFIKVCHAVQHAHQKGIIHRDIKPTNVLVTLHSGEPVPRVIDFGVAKALGCDLTEKTLFTRYGQVVGTPHYMSPEQAERSDLDIDTRSDIYSLGVVLFELLTGDTPLYKRRLKTVALDEVLRLVREEDTPTPSTRISNLGVQSAFIAERRGTELSRLGKILRGDLDWIVMRALEKDRKRRFESVGEFILDIERHLADEPVAAGPPSKIYRASKFVRRNRIGVIAASAVVGALFLGLTLAVIGLRQANRERSNAIESASEAQTMLTVLRYMVETNPDAGRGRDFTLRQMLDRFSAGLRAIENGEIDADAIPKIWMRDYKNIEREVFQVAFPDLSDKPAIAAEIHGLLGLSYMDLDLYDEALLHFHREYDLCRITYGKKHARVAWAAYEIAAVHRARAKRAATGATAEQDIEDALRYSEIAVSTFDTLGSYSQSSMIPRGIYGELLTTTGEAGRAEEILRRTIRKLVARRTELPDADGALLFLRSTLVTSLAQQGKKDESIHLGRVALNHALKYHAGTGNGRASKRAWANIRFGDVLRDFGEMAEAHKHYNEALVLVEREPKSFMYFVATSRCAVAHAKLFQYEEAMALWEKLLGFKEPEDIIVVYHFLVLLDLNLGRFDEAVRRCEEMLARAGEAASASDIRTVARFMRALIQSQRNSDNCHALCDDALPEARHIAEEGFDWFSVSYSWFLLNKSQPTEQDVAIAIQHANKALATLKHDHMIALAHHSLALAYSRDSSSKDSNLAVANAELAIIKMPKHESFLRALLDQEMAKLRDPRSE